MACESKNHAAASQLFPLVVAFRPPPYQTNEAIPSSRCNICQRVTPYGEVLYCMYK